MTVYVDDGAIPFGRMKMSHMVADSTAELVGMAERIGLDTRWLQRRGTWAEHFDVARSKRQAAIAAGAVEMTRRELAKYLSERK